MPPAPEKIKPTVGSAYAYMSNCTERIVGEPHQLAAGSERLVQPRGQLRVRSPRAVLQVREV
jgi:hypothetical protein